MYFKEFRLHWRPLAAAGIGMGLGSALGHYTLSLFGPPLLAEFGWTRSQFALVGTLPLLTLFLVPLAGHLTDRFGARIAATVGFTAMSLGFLAFGLMPGGIEIFFLIWALQQVFGMLTTSFVFCRVVVERFDAARGIALSIAMTAPPLVGAIAAPTLGGLIDAEGWRAGYFALAAVTAIGGILAVFMMGRETRSTSSKREEAGLTRKELGKLLSNPTLLLILGGMFLVNIPQVFASSQLKLIVMDSGVSSQTATWMMSLYAMGVIIGRFLSGLALDRVEAHLVAIAALGLPAIGYFTLAGQFGGIAVLSTAIAIIGFAQGAESDIGAYLISRRFEIKNFSLLLSMMTAMIAAGSAVGSAILSVTLLSSDSYTAFLLIAVAGTLLGAAMFAMTGSTRLKTRVADA